MNSLLPHVRFQGRPYAGRVRTTRESAAAAPRPWPRRIAIPPLAGDEARLCEAILDRAGLALTDLRSAPLARRLPAVLRTLRARDARQALALVEHTAEAHQRALTALLIGHTVPFRDESVFGAIRRYVIPRLPARPRVWSLGCSRGLELLSVALLLDERANLPSALRGSDLRRIAPLEDVHLVRDFAAGVPGEFAVLASRATPDWIRQQVVTIEWRSENVLSAELDGGWDLILCRNLAIYLEVEAADRLWQRIAAALRPGGFLVVGKAERPAVADLRRAGPCIYWRPRGPGGAHAD